jgi:hypothetical protein
MSKNKELKTRIFQLNMAVYMLSEQLALKRYIHGMTPSHDSEIKAFEKTINAFKEKVNEDIFNLMLHSSHRSFMKYLKEMDD